MNAIKEVRRLRFQVIEGHRRTGQILDHLPQPIFAHTLAKSGMSSKHARVCIELHQLWLNCNWDAYEPVDDWWRDEGHSSPRTPDEAVTMLRTWRLRLH